MFAGRARVDRSPWLPAGVIALALQAGACAAPSEQRQRLERLEGRVGAAESLEARVDELERRVDGYRSATQRVGDDGRARVEALAADLRAASATLTDLTRRLDLVERALASQPGAPPAPPRASAGHRTATSPQREPGPAASLARAAAAEAARPRAPAGEGDPLALARDQEARGERGVARALYEEYAARFPSDPATAEALFRLGDLSAQEGRHRDAAVAFGRVARDFPGSPRAPDALARTGEAMRALGLEEADAVLADVVARYPGTPAAARAERLLGASRPKGAGGSAR